MGAPVDVISAADFASQGDTDVSTLLRTLAPSYNDNQPISDAATGRSPRPTSATWRRTTRWC